MTKLGATGRFPIGQIADDDQGQLCMAIRADHQHGVVKVEFGTLIGWLGLPPREARIIAQMLLATANEVDARRH